MDAITWNTGHGWTKWHLLTDDGQTRCGAAVPWLAGQWRAEDLTAARWPTACETCKEHVLREAGHAA